MSTTTTTVLLLSGAGFLETGLYYLEETATVILILLIAFALITLLLLLGYLLWSAGKSALLWARRIGAVVFTAHSQRHLLPHSPAGLHLRR
jgi:hypothetical protein